MKSVVTTNDYALEKSQPRGASISATQDVFYTNREIVCMYGSVEKKFKLTLFSNQPITTMEYESFTKARKLAR